MGTKTTSSRNTFEAYIFNAQDKLSEPEVIEITTEDKLGEIKGLLDEAQAWLETDGDEATTQILTARLNALKREVDPILKAARGQTADDQKTLEREGTAGSASAKEKA